MAWGAPLPAPAKINQFLHVIGRRADGYHLLQTVFRFLDRADQLRFFPRDDGEVILRTPLPGVPAQSDLTVRAAHALQRATGCRRGVEIELEKNLPLGGGLGGGSSDAATVLIALNRLWGLDLPRERLQAIGLELGADVPVFVFGRAAFGEGVGERLSALSLAPAWYLVVVAPAPVATASVFAEPALTRDSPAVTIAAFSADGRVPAQLLGFGRNDLEAVVRRKQPEVDQVLQELCRYPGARMSGSGSSCFAWFADEASARSALATLPPRWPAWVARGIDFHPLFG
ncbi:MAG: 4-(cytidine 5'-diphospho)-2-C-methyl-D-erythritol kinase [Rhodocyclaceae bacterium]|nr:4-(cytidine 5'-diphospho)-2-C-methyl-D-erythritol kinase [Rhodocyclaceae bacterium]MBX3667377.1 4-(cytidine 5'-diphospho)-2-C-methyl-D-erythritol kinase [Rhodocyclaceae bacterium]